MQSKSQAFLFELSYLLLSRKRKEKSMSTKYEKKKQRQNKRLKKYGIEIEPVIIDGMRFDAEKFMMENRFNTGWRKHPHWIAYNNELKRRKALADKTKREMKEAGLDVKIRDPEKSYAEDHFEKQEMEAYHKSVSSVLSTIGSLEAVKEMTKQQVPVPIWTKAKLKRKLTSDEVIEVPLSKLLEMTNIFVKISDAQLKAISKVVDVEGINKAKKEAKEKFKSYNSQNSIQQIDFEAINNDEIVLNEENIEVINDIEEENLDKPVTKDKVKDYLSRILN